MSRKPLRDLSHEQYRARLRPLINQYANENNQENGNDEIHNIDIEMNINNEELINDNQIENDANEILDQPM